MQRATKLFLLTIIVLLFTQCSTTEWTTDLNGSAEFKANAEIYEMKTIPGLSVKQNISFGPYSTGDFKLANQESFSITLNKDGGESCTVKNKAQRKEIRKTVNVNGQQKEVAAGKILTIDLDVFYKNQRGHGLYKSNERTMFEHRLLKMNMLSYTSYNRKDATRFDGVLFRSEDNNELIGAVDCRTKKMWISKSLSDDQKHILATVAIALSYKPPS